MKKVFITGGCGFIGSHLTEHLAKRDYKIVLYDNLHRNAIQYTDMLNHPSVEFINGDITDTTSLEKAMKGADLVIHMAAIAGVTDYYLNPSLTLKVNLIGTYNVLEALRKNNINRLIDMSSSEVLGTEVIGSDEDAILKIGPPKDRRWAYSVGKLAGEQMIYRYSEDYSWNATIIRLFNIYGPRQVGESAISNFYIKALKGSNITVDGDGSSLRSWCFISDFIEALSKIIDKPHPGTEIFNIGDPWTTISNLNLAKMVLHIVRNDISLKGNPQIIFREMPFTDIKARYPNVSKISKAYKWQPKVTIEEGLKETYEWFKKNIDKL